MGVAFLLVGMLSCQSTRLIQRRVCTGEDFEQTLSKVQQKITQEDMQLMQIIRHDQFARKSGQELRPTAVLVFGNPKVGTALMQESAEVAYFLPLKILVYQEGECTVLAYQNPLEYKRLGIKKHQNILQKMQQRLQQIINEI